ncbi:MAG: TetR family transcriptional regulator [Gammaproteobacteria bacterium]|nr:TetR family transcriptional regulator [Gammaproteobacteria bacterium]
MKEVKINEIPLRARQRARTRLALTRALMERLSERALEDIQVSELAEAAEISQATFFNYFPTKSDLLSHFIQLWSLRMCLVVRLIRQETDGAIAAVEALFAATAEDMAPYPKVMLEIIAHHARMPLVSEREPIELAERLLFLSDDNSNVETLTDRGLGDLLRPLLREAVIKGELPAGSDIEVLTAAVASVFFGVPLNFAAQQPDAIASLYQQQLRLVWAGARSIVK